MEVSDRQIVETLLQVNRKSQPGHPWGNLATTKGELIDNYLPLLILAVRERLNVLNSREPLPVSAVEFVQRNYCDPIQQFVKNEPHKVEKIRTGRYRLIGKLSIVDEVVQRLLYYAQNCAEIENWLTCPSKPGIGMTDEMAASFVELMPLNGESSDISGLDWSVKGWQLDLEIQQRIMLCGASPESSYSVVASAHGKAIGLSVFVLSDGSMIAQSVYGLVKSGEYITSSRNSRIRVNLSIMTGSEWSQAQGDDCGDSIIPNKIQAYKEFGFKLRDVEPFGDEDFEFCSHRWSRTKRIAVPLNWEKMTINLLNSAPSSDMLFQYRYVMRHSPKLESCMELIDRVGWSPTKDLIE